MGLVKNSWGQIYRLCDFVRLWVEYKKKVLFLFLHSPVVLPHVPLSSPPAPSSMLDGESVSDEVLLSTWGRCGGAIRLLTGPNKHGVSYGYGRYSGGSILAQQEKRQVVTVEFVGSETGGINSSFNKSGCVSRNR